MAWSPYYRGHHGGSRGSGRRRGHSGRRGRGRRRGNRGGNRGGGRPRKYEYNDDDDEEDDYETYEYDDGDDDYDGYGTMYAGESISDVNLHDEEDFSDEEYFSDEEDVGEDLEGFERITPEEYFSSAVEAAPSMDLDNAKHMRVVAQSGHKIAVEDGDSEIAEGFADIIDAVEARIAEEYEVDHVSELMPDELASEATLQSKDIAEQTKGARESHISLMDALADEHDPVELLNRFKVEGKRWKKYTLPRFSKDASIPEDYDYRRIITDHDRLTYFYATTRRMQTFSQWGKIKVSGGRTGKEDVSTEFGRYAEILANGMKLALVNQLRNWKCGIKFLVMRGVASMYGDEYGRTDGSVENTRAIKEKFITEFVDVMRGHIQIELSTINFESRAYLRGESTNDPKYSEKSQSHRDTMIKHVEKEVAPFFTRLVLFSLGQSKSMIKSSMGESIQKRFVEVWTQHADKTIVFVKTLASTGFQKDPIKLKTDVDAMFADGKDLGTLINSYVYGMIGEPAPGNIVRRLFTIIEL
ncbi:MAG: hypothetical protein ACTSUE_25245 [Promethearchaeota archaeon]